MTEKLLTYQQHIAEAVAFELHCALVSSITGWHRSAEFWLDLAKDDLSAVGINV